MPCCIIFTHMNEEVLDQPPVKPSPARYRYALYASLPLCGYWAAAGLFHWPYALDSLFGGCMLMLLYLGWAFITRKVRPPYAWAYFAGRVALVCGVFLHLAKAPWAAYFTITAALGFIAGMLLLHVGQRKDSDTQ